MSQINQLIYRYLDDRESLSEEEMEQLVSVLRNRPTLAKQVKDQMIVQELLGQSLAIDRKNFTAQVEQRIRDLNQPLPLGQDLEEEMDASHSPDENEQEDIDDESDDYDALEEEEIESRPEYVEHAHRHIEKWTKQNKSRRFKKWAVVMLFMFVLGGGYSYWSIRVAPHVAVITLLDGTNSLTRSSVNQPLSMNLALMEGDELTTTGTVGVRYPDGTVVTVAPNSRVQFQKRKLNWFPIISGKQVQVVSGTVNASVTPQWSRFPMHFTSSTATAIILGTELSFHVTTDSTRLNVKEGKVELKRAADQSSVIVQDQEVGFASASRLDVAKASWPDNSDGLLLLFETATKLSQTQDLNGETEALQLTPRKDAEIDSDGRLDVRKGSFLIETHASDISELLREACQKTNELSIETTFQTANLKQTGPARIITFAQDSNNRNFTLCQRDRQMVLRLTTDNGTRWKEIALFEIPDRKTHHLVISYRTGELVAWLDGKRIFETNQVRGTFAKWENFPVVVGADVSEKRSWAGILEGIAIYNRFVTENEARENAIRYQQLLDQRHQ